MPNYKKMDTFLRNEEIQFKKNKENDRIFCKICKTTYTRENLKLSSGYATDGSKNYGHFVVYCSKEHILIEKESDKWGMPFADFVRLSLVIGGIILFLYLLFSYGNFTPDPIRYK